MLVDDDDHHDKYDNDEKNINFINFFTHILTTYQPKTIDEVLFDYSTMLNIDSFVPKDLNCF